jgi:hydroxyethylthiazole kinase-like uncharacterized protein yjeF
MNTPATAAVPVPLYRARDLRELDRRLTAPGGIAGYTLMTRAASAAWALLRQCWPAARVVKVLCGPGNNGGDGYVLARLAREAGCTVEVLTLGAAGRATGDAATARADWLAAGGVSRAFAPERLQPADLLVDALLGTGARCGLDADWIAALQAINASAVPVLALDTPSGLDSDSGHVADVAIRAQHTITFIGHKPGLYTGQGPEHAGAVTLAGLDIPAAALASLVPSAMLYRGVPAGLLDTPRARAAHKGCFVHVLVLGGNHGMSGAARLAGEAALRCGAGRVSVATRAAHAAMLAAGCPELMCHGVETVAGLKQLLARATVIVVGPGFGTDAWSKSLLAPVLEAVQPVVLDADALNLLAREPQRQARWILTPHPGEAARLLDSGVAEIERDRFAALASINQRYGGVTLLKGAGTLVTAAGGPVQLCAAGNPGMAGAGMGDVLSGVIAALLAQGMPLHEAAITGTCVHAVAADAAALAGGERGLLARDVIAQLRAVVNRP